MACSIFRGARLLVLIASVVALGHAASVLPPGFSPLPRDFKPAGVHPREPQLKVNFPGGAAARGISQGRAVISILVGADGKPVDLIAVQHTDPAFARELLEHARTLSYVAGAWKGTAVPSRFELGYQFESGNTSVNVMEAARARMSRGGSTYEPVAESELDEPLKLLNVALPRIPASYPVPDDQSVQVFVTFYVDEEGHTRAPNVEAAAAPVLFGGAIKAVRQWTFKPPTVKGKPALVYAGTTVTFLPRTPPPAPDSQASPPPESGKLP